MKAKISIYLVLLIVTLTARVTIAGAQAKPDIPDAQPKPNILMIMGDDIGYWNLSIYNQGMMGYRTPNI
ncbi:MAG: hypothetical protein ACREP6_05515, partial [Candidatus Binataceae bacterium]